MVAHHYNEVKLVPQQVENHLELSGLKYFADLMVSPGKYQIKLVVRNPENGHVGTAIKQVTVSEKRNSIHAGPFMVSSAPWIVIDSSNLDQEDELPYPYKFGKNRFVPLSEPLVRRGDTTRLLFLVDRNLLKNNSNLEVAVLVMDKEGAYQQASSDTLAYAVYQDKSSPWSGLLLSLKTGSFALEANHPYKFFTRITVGGTESLLAALPFQIQEEI